MYICNPKRSDGNIRTGKMFRELIFGIWFRDVAQPGSALAWGARGRKFESCRPDLTGQIGIIPVCPVFIFPKTLIQTVY